MHVNTKLLKTVIYVAIQNILITPPIFNALKLLFLLPYCQTEFNWSFIEFNGWHFGRHWKWVNETQHMCCVDWRHRMATASSLNASLLETYESKNVSYLRIQFKHLRPICTMIWKIWNFCLSLQLILSFIQFILQEYTTVLS